MEGLGRVFNVVPTAADTPWVSMKQCGAVAFIGVGTDTYTIDQATNAAGGSAANLAVIDHYYRSTSAAGAAGYTRVNQAVAATFSATAGGIAIAQINATSLADGFKYLRCTSTGAGLVVAVVYDLEVQRDPTRLVALGV